MLTLLPATLADQIRADQLLASCLLPGLDEGAQFGPRYVLAVDETTGELVGIAGVQVEGPDAILRSVAVVKTRRGEGLGERLVLDRIAWARAAGLTDLYLLTTGAAEYFAPFGFTIFAREAAPAAISGSYQWSQVCPASSTAMKLRLA